jgi:hypothetical protein
MVWDGYIVRPVDFMGNRQVNPLDQMGRACNSLDATWNRQDDDGFSPWIGSMKGLSTMFQVDYEIWVLPFLYDMNYSVIVSWGVLFQRSQTVSLLWLSRNFPEFTLDSALLKFSYVPFLSHLTQSFSVWLRLGIASPPSKSDPFVFPSTCAWSALPRLLQNHLPLSFMDNRQKSHKEPRATNSHGLFCKSRSTGPRERLCRVSKAENSYGSNQLHIDLRVRNSLSAQAPH